MARLLKIIKKLELKPNYYEAYENLGIVLGKNNKNNQAEKVLKILIKKSRICECV